MNVNVEELKQTFDKVKIKHFNTVLYRGTHAALVKDGKVYVGTSRVHVNDQFDKRKGVNVAVGRALHAWKMDAGVTRERSDLRDRQYQVIPATTPEELDKVLTTNIFTEPKFQKPSWAKDAPAEIPAEQGCCGGCKQG